MPALRKPGLSAIVWTGLLTTGAFIVLSPLFGFFLALALILTVSWVFVRANPRTVEPVFQWLQFAAASLISLGHGGNDAQKTMGIIAVLLFSQGLLGGEFYVPFWVVITCQAAIGLGTLIGGWRIVKTVGSKITRMTPVQGCCASAGGAIMLFAATYLGIPVSTTHTVTGSSHRRRCRAQSVRCSLEHRRQHSHRLDRHVCRPRGSWPRYATLWSGSFHISGAVFVWCTSLYVRLSCSCGGISSGETRHQQI